MPTDRRWPDRLLKKPASRVLNTREASFVSDTDVSRFTDDQGIFLNSLLILLPPPRFSL
jgi:hypothetical protein